MQSRQPTLHHLSTLISRGWHLVGAPQRPVLFVNPRAGDGAAGRHGVIDLARERGVETVTVCPGEDLRARVSEFVAEGADVLGMAGGDGSLAVVASVAAAHELPFVCIPVGMRNHFAIDLGVDRRDVAGALDAFTVGVERRIDVAHVNGHMFLNNVALGIEGAADRKAAYRGSKVRALAETARRVLAPGVLMPELRLVDGPGQKDVRPAVLLISNNPYAFEGPGAGTRPTLGSGRLGILGIDALQERRPAPGRTWSSPHLEVQAPVETHVRLDGEAVELVGLLRFEVQPAALRVRISRRHPGASPSARLRSPMSYAAPEYVPRDATGRFTSRFTTGGC
ncbi:diacylglycerol kinase family protein [Terrabacter lapilli]|uniref:Diacylglycerol kinase family protein n=1 Tax=Terrabacter lapilli TaxID=436231 RepID=A0ABN2RSY8_9MICO